MFRRRDVQAKLADASGEIAGPWLLLFEI